MEIVQIYSSVPRRCSRNRACLIDSIDSLFILHRVNLTYWENLFRVISALSSLSLVLERNPRDAYKE